MQVQEGVMEKFQKALSRCFSEIFNIEIEPETIPVICKDSKKAFDSPYDYSSPVCFRYMKQLGMSAGDIAAKIAPRLNEILNPDIGVKPGCRPFYDV